MSTRSAVLVGPRGRARKSGIGDSRAPAARAREAMLKSFKIHLAVYLPVNLLLIGMWAVGGGAFWPVWPILGWGLAVACHAAPILAGVGSRTCGPAGQTMAGLGHAPDGATSADQVGATIEGQRPSIQSVAAPEGTVTILFSDIEASTALNERLGDLRWLELLLTHHAIVRDQVHAHGGYEVKAQGD